MTATLALHPSAPASRASTLPLLEIEILETACSRLRNRAHRPSRFESAEWENILHRTLRAYPRAASEPLLGAPTLLHFLCRSPRDLASAWIHPEAAAAFGAPPGGLWSALLGSFREIWPNPEEPRQRAELAMAFSGMHPEVAEAALDAFVRDKAAGFDPACALSTRESFDPFSKWLASAEPPIRSSLERCAIAPASTKPLPQKITSL